MSSPGDPVPPLRLAGVDIRRLTSSEAIDHVLAAAADGWASVAWMYAHCVNLALDNPRYADDLRAHSFVFNDGVGIELAARLAGRPVRDNLVGTDWIPLFLGACAARASAPRRVFLLGSTAAVGTTAGRLIADRWPSLTVVGTHDGYFEDPAAALKAIAEARPEILIVAMGVPGQERFVIEHAGALRAAGVRVTLCGGAILDFMTGVVPRAPELWRRLRLEWVWRLLQEPRRLWRRYILGTARFLLRTGWQAATGRLRRDQR